jgi:tetratricopeptide (TPR) repeat protein
MRAFIVRPFGVKSGIDFDRVDTELIQPALRELLIDGGTTGLVIEAGNIREDMFRLLLVADLVIADISIDNANVYYELGIRQALREKRTFLLRATGTTNDVPFDLKTDRYLPYDPAAPGKSLPAFTAGLEATLAEERQDSPVFKMLPDLREQSRTRFLTVPRDFREEVEYAAATRRAGQLALLGFEAKGAVWESEGLRLVATEQFRARQFEGAAQTYEDFRQISPLDREANLRLATVYQRLGDIPKSLEAQRRVIAQTDAPASDLAEAYSLLGSTLKDQWRTSWKASQADKKRATALNSGFLMSSYEEYLRAFRHDVNHYYSGLNALAMVTIVLKLAQELPDVWLDRIGDDGEASRATAELEAQRQRLTGAVEVSIDAAARAADRLGRQDRWIGVSLADFKFLTASRPGPVVRAYEQALTGQPELVAESVRKQLAVYEELGLFQDRVQRIIDTLPAVPPPAPPRRMILFTGHQIDRPGRPEPRFPADKEAVAREAIRDAVNHVLARNPGAVGIAGCANGGDILFHEVCADLGVPTTAYLAVPAELYVPQSVAPAGPEWVQRFWAIQTQTPSPPVLARTLQTPAWLRHRAGYSLWQRNNLWILNEALSTGARNVTLIALWNGQRGDGPGGTSDMISRAGDRGAETRVLDTTALFNLPAPHKA